MSKNGKLMCNGRHWYVINWESGWSKCHKLFKLYPLVSQSDKDIFVQFGYKILSSGAKETFYTLVQLSSLNKKKGHGYACTVSLDFLSVLLGTSRECQSRRINKLKQVGLLSICYSEKGIYAPNTYKPSLVIPPDSTFVSTVINLIRRRRFLDYVNLYKNDVFIRSRGEKKELLQNINKLLKKLPKYKKTLSNDILRELSEI